ncbi:MAG: PAS domain S-box protein [Deltaproteobacteria bacterium]|nr:PAS domain S-box protein [Deltaproteobacteria bacterium]
MKKRSKQSRQRHNLQETIQQLRASEERYRDLFENATDAIATFTLEGIVTRVNREAERKLDWSREEMIGQPYQKFLTPASVAHIEERTRRAPAEEKLPSSFELELVRKNGGVVPVEARTRFIHDAEGNLVGIQGIYRDITKRKQAEARIRFLSAALFQANCAVIVVDMEGRITYWNRGAERLYGFKSDEVYGRTVEDVLQVRWLEGKTAETARRALEATGSWRGENIHVKKSEEEIYAESSVTLLRDDNGTVVGVLAVTRDITERKRMEEALRQSEERFSKAFRASPLQISITTLAEGRYLDANDSFLRLVGYDREEVIGHTAAELRLWVNPEDRATLAQMLDQRQPVHETEIKFHTKSGEIRDGLVSEEPIDLNGELCILSMLRDITERRRTEEKLQDYAERLRILSHRLMEVQESERRAIARELHDEIGQVLTGLRLTLEASLHLPAEAARERMGAALTLANELIGRVRELALELRPAMLDDLGLVPALEWHYERYTGQTQVRVNFTHTGLASRPPQEVETAAYRIVQASLTNVALHAGVNEVTVRLRADQDQLVIEIQDQGMGFDPDTVLAGSASSGLAGMRERAMLLGGQLTVESAPGDGTLVTAILPLVMKQGS